MTPPTITDLAEWIGTDPEAALRAHQWTWHAACGSLDWQWWRLHYYALGHLHALERLRGYPVPR